MARMIPQRKSPPYLLIIMVFLFLISTGLAVKMYMDREEAEKKTRQAEAIRGVMTTKDQLEKQVLAYLAAKTSSQTVARIEDPSIPGLCEKFREAASANEAPGLTVVANLQSQIDELTMAIVGTETSTPAALAKVKALRTSLNDKLGHTLGGLVQTISDLETTLVNVRGKDGKGGEIAGLIAAKDTEQDKTKAVGLELQNLTNSHGAQITAIEAKRDETLGQLTTEQAAHEKQMTELEAGKTRIMEELNKQLAVQGTELAQLKLDVESEKAKRAVKEAEVDQLKSQIAILKRERTAEAAVVRQITSDGEVMNDPDRQGYCYINIGAKDGVKRNWTFAVYAAGPITEATQNKGALVVTRVLADVAECRLTKSVGGQVTAIAKGDLIANLAFDASRTYIFTVEGVFDLHGTGKATMAGTEAVKALIANYGGKVSDEVTISTDYVVLGNEMPKPVAPGPDAPPQVRQAYEDNLKIWQRYNDVKKRAIELKIPVLNANRFLDYIGQMPEKRLEYTD